MDDAHTGGQRTVTGNSITISGKLTLLSYKAQLTVLNEGGDPTGRRFYADADRSRCRDAVVERRDGL